MSYLRRLFKGQRGLSLMELTVVAAILAVLAALTAVAVTGTTTATKGVAKTNDEAEVSKAGSSFSGAHPFAYLPVTLGSSGSPREYTVSEATSGNDLNDDGDITDTAVIVYQIDFSACDAGAVETGGTCSGDTFTPDYLKKPKHANDSSTDAAGATIGVWVFVRDSSEAKALLSDSAY